MWQGDLICDILRLDDEGWRVYWTFLVLVPRKNSKSLLGGGLAIDGLIDEPGAEVYSCAADKDQAKIVFAEVKTAVEMSPELDAKQGGLFKVYRDAIEYPSMGSVYKALSAEAFTKEGLNPSRVIFDELHAQPNDELWNVMNQGSDTRQQPLILAISTFGVKTDSTGRDSVCYGQYQYAKRIISGEVVDARYGARIYETDERVAGFDYRDHAVWHAANPALGDFLYPEKMDAACRKMPEADFKTKRLNIWVSAARAWLPAGAWAACVDCDRTVPDGTEVCLGFDGSFNNDSTALTLVTCVTDDNPVPHVDVVECWEKPPEAGNEWTVPILAVEEALRAACRRWQVREIVCDPARWARTYQVLEEEGLPVVDFPQSPARMVPATQRFYEAVVNRALTHSGDPRLARHLDNCTVRTDTRGSRISKESKSSPRKIDLAISAVMALERASQPPPPPAEADFISWDDL